MDQALEMCGNMLLDGWKKLETQFGEDCDSVLNEVAAWLLSDQFYLVVALMDDTPFSSLSGWAPLEEGAFFLVIK